jgi:hypothetical protein
LKSNQKGFSPVFLVAIVIVILAVIGGAYAVMNRQDLAGTTNDAIVEMTDETVANGTPENAVKAVSEQISTEIMAEDAAMKLEEEATKIEDSITDSLEGIANEANL